MNAVGRRVLVVGGGGPTGPLVVNGLLARGCAVTVLNTGRHPVEYDQPVERIVADPHFVEPLRDALAGRTFDVAIAQYGRLRYVADVLAGRVEQFIALGGMFYPGWIDPPATQRPETESGRTRDWSVAYLDEAAPVPETVPLEPVGGFGARVVATDADLRVRHLRGDFSLTTLRYPRVFGPGQLGAAEWSIIRRILDGRTRILLPENGFLVQSILYVENAARTVLAACDQPAAFAGKVLNCADADPITTRKWVSMIAASMGAEIDIVSAPMAHAGPSWPYARFPLTTGHHILDTSAMRALVPSLVPTRTGIQRTVEWYLGDVEARGRAVEGALKDPFDYDLEDAMFAEIDRSHAALDALDAHEPQMGHPYPHPTAAADDAVTDTQGSKDDD